MNCQEYRFQDRIPKWDLIFLIYQILGTCRRDNQSIVMSFTYIHVVNKFRCILSVWYKLMHWKLSADDFHITLYKALAIHYVEFSITTKVINLLNVSDLGIEHWQLSFPYRFGLSWQFVQMSAGSQGSMVGFLCIPVIFRWIKCLIIWPFCI